MSKIVHLTSVHRASDTRIFYKECRSLQEAGYNVALVAPHHVNEVKDGVQIYGIAESTSRWTRMWETSRLVVETANAVDADLYHLHDPELLPWAAALLDGTVPLVYDMHEDLIAQVKTKGWIPKIVRPLVGSFASVGLRFFLSQCPVVFAERSYSQRYNWIRQSAIVQNMPPVSEMVGIDEPKHGKPTLGYLGTVRSDRGSIVTVEAMSLLQQEGYEVDWECIGPSEPASHQSTLKELITRLSVSGIRFRGYLPAQEAWQLISRCHIGVALLDHTPNFADSYPTKLFEYMALGLPVVTSDIPLYRDVVESSGCGKVVDPNDPKDVADAIASLLDNPGKAAEMGERGRKEVRKKYGWNHEAGNLLSFYNDLLSRA